MDHGPPVFVLCVCVFDCVSHLEFLGKIYIYPKYYIVLCWETHIYIVIIWETFIIIIIILNNKKCFFKLICISII